MSNKPEIIVIGSGIVDVLVTGVDKGVFERGSTPAQVVSMQTGGDALNEAMILSRLGRRVRLVSRVGQDAAGDLIIGACQGDGVDISGVRRDAELDTGVNVVLVDEKGERRFITNPNSGLRKIMPEHVLEAVSQEDFHFAKIACYASMFVHPTMTGHFEEVFSAIKSKGVVLCVDTTKPKNGETVEDIRNALEYVDYLMPNYDEAVMITGETEPERIANRFLECGVKNAVIKLGGRGCLVKNASVCRIIPAVPGIAAVDTTGAGDNFAAGFINALYEGKTPEECAMYANAVASICVEHVGAAAGERDRAEIERRVEMIRQMAQKSERR